MCATFQSGLKCPFGNKRQDYRGAENWLLVFLTKTQQTNCPTQLGCKVLKTVAN